MLLSYSVANYKSIKNAVELSFVPDKGSEFAHTNLVQISKGESALKTLVLYGANASGKSNLLESIRAFNYAVCFGGNNKSNGLANEEIWPVPPYSFDDSSMDEPTKFTIEVAIEGTRYLYCLDVKQSGLCGENLFTFVNGRKRKIYGLSGNKFTFGTILDNDVKEQLTKIKAWRQGKTFLATIAREKKKELELFNKLYRTLELIIYVKIPNYTIPRELTARYIAQPEGKKEVLALLKSADSGIDDIRIEKNKDSKDGYDIGFCYAVNGRKRFVEYAVESDGNRKMFDFASILLTVLNIPEEALLVVDEFDNSLHPSIIDGILEQFNRGSDRKQLICSMHYTGNMNKLRRDQIVLVEKDKKSLTTDAFAMSEFKGVRKDLDKEKAYLRGTFGATPFVDFKFGRKDGK